MAVFTDKVVVVTGGGSGIGEATCVMFGQEGATVAVVDMNMDGANNVVNKIKEAGGKAAAFSCDVSDWDSVQSMTAAVKAELGRVDVLFNNAGIAPRASVEEMSVELWKKVIAVDLDSVFYVTKAMLPHLKETEGNIINTGSNCSISGWANLAAYTAAKAGVLMMTKEMAVEFQPYKVRVNTVFPGVVATPMQLKVWKEQGLDYETMDKSGIQQPEDIARAVLFFADNVNGQVSGNFLAVNGVHNYI